MNEPEKFNYQELIRIINEPGFLTDQIKRIEAKHPLGKIWKVQLFYFRNSAVQKEQERYIKDLI